MHQANCQYILANILPWASLPVLNYVLFVDLQRDTCHVRFPQLDDQPNASSILEEYAQRKNEQYFILQHEEKLKLFYSFS